MKPDNRERGYVVSVTDDYVLVYLKNSPTKELLLEPSPKYSRDLKLAYEIEFDVPSDFEAGVIYSPEELKVSLFEDKHKRENLENPTKWSQIGFITNAIFTTSEADDSILRDSSILATGYSRTFGRFIVQDTFEGNQIEFERGKLYRCVVKRFPKKISKNKLKQWGTVLVCEKVLSIKEDEYRLINELQEECPWSQNLDPVKPPSKSFTKEYVFKTDFTRSAQPKDICFEDFNGELIPFALVVECTDEYTSIYSPAHRSFFRVSPSFTDLVPGLVCGIKLFDEKDGIFQKCTINSKFLNMTSSVKSIAPGFIEAIFDVELFRAEKNILPDPWTIYGDSKHLGKVLIPENKNLPPMGKIVKVRAMFMNKPIEEFCWVFIELLEIVDPKMCLEQRTHSISSEQQQVEQEPKSAISVEQPISSKIDATVFTSKPKSVEKPVLSVPTEDFDDDITVSARLEREYSTLPKLINSEDEMDNSDDDDTFPTRSNGDESIQNNANQLEIGETLPQKKTGYPTFNPNADSSDSSDEDSGASPGKYGFGEDCAKGDYGDQNVHVNRKDNLSTKDESIENSKICDESDNSDNDTVQDEVIENSVAIGIGEDDPVGAFVVENAYDSFGSDGKSEESDQHHVEDQVATSSNNFSSLDHDKLPEELYERFESTNFYENKMEEIQKNPVWKFCVVETDESDKGEDQISVGSDSNNSLMIDEAPESGEESDSAEQSTSSQEQARRNVLANTESLEKEDVESVSAPIQPASNTQEVHPFDSSENETSSDDDNVAQNSSNLLKEPNGDENIEDQSDED